jgi:hypothetical protein
VAVARRLNGNVATSGAAFVVLNDEGWMVTAAHLFQLDEEARQHATAVANHESRVLAVESDSSLRPEARGRALKRLRQQADATWITNVSYWWARNGASVRDITTISDADIAIGRLHPAPDLPKGSYPVIKNPAVGMRQGTSLCRLGFPFHDIQASFESATKQFTMNQQFTFFPLDGIFTRVLDIGTTAPGGYPHKYVETSTPGLRGQSGGPLFDVNGRLWGIQSRTRHIPLGFNPTIDDGRTKTVEHQFINLGEAVHCETLVAILTDIGVAFDLSAD